MKGRSIKAPLVFSASLAACGSENRLGVPRSVRESSVEQYLCRRVADLRGLCIKLDARYYRGIPDRLVILPRGGVCFVETKRPRGGAVSPAQKLWKERLEAYGHSVFIVSTREQVDSILPPA